MSKLRSAQAHLPATQKHLALLAFGPLPRHYGNGSFENLVLCEYFKSMDLLPGKYVNTQHSMYNFKEF